MIDYKQVVIECGMIALECERSGAEQMAAHERACRDSIFELLNRVKAAEKSAKDTGEIANHWEYLYGNELGYRKATEIRAEKAEAETERLRAERDKADAQVKQLGDQLVEAWRHLAFAVAQFQRIDDECKLCAHIEGLESCEASDYDCGHCKADCRCRSCKSTPEGRSNWTFAGWDKVMEIGKEG